MAALPSPSSDSDQRPSRVVAIGASAGGVEALVRIAQDLPADFPAAVCVVLHIPATGRSLLAPILDRASSLHAVVAADGMPAQRGHIYVAPADHHLLVTGGRLALTSGPKENGARPAVDVLFRSAAETWGERAIAVVLSGALDDGASGAAAVASAGGRVVVQDPVDAVVPGMPESAITASRTECVLPLHAIPELLVRLAAEPTNPTAPREVPVPSVPGPSDMSITYERPDGRPSGFTCPECHGALWELREGELVRYRCRVGHAYSEEAFIDDQATAVEAAMWSALKALEERSELLERVARRLESSRPSSARKFRSSADGAREQAELIRRALGDARATGRSDQALAG